MTASATLARNGREVDDQTQHKSDEDHLGHRLGVPGLCAKDPATADYALLADYGIGRTPDGKTVVGSVQVIVCDRKGDWVLVAGQISRQPDFQRINPQSPDDCNHLAVELLTNELR